MGMWNRLTTLLRANLNHVVKSAEDPERVLDQLILDMQDQMTRAKREVAVVIAHERRLKSQLGKEKKLAQEWERKAMMAIRASRDDLAKEALRRKAEHDALVEGFHEQWEAQKASSEALKGSLRKLDAKIGEARRRKQSLVARKRHVEAQRTIQKTMAEMSKHNPSSRFDEFARRIDEEEARLEAAREVDAHTSGSDLEARFEKLAREDRADDALAALKAKMGVDTGRASFSFEEEDEEVAARHEHAIHVGA